jgi:thymidylate kinase
MGLTIYRDRARVDQPMTGGELNGTTIKRPVFVSINGQKGTGKTTLIHGVMQIMPSSLTVMALSEKDVDPYRNKTEELLRTHRAHTTHAVEQEIVHLLAAGRAAISKGYPAERRCDVVLIDRWYPSDAYFRRCVPFSDVLATNIAEGVAKPDLILAAVCDPHESWRRATTRPRGLAVRRASTSINTSPPAVPSMPRSTSLILRDYRPMRHPTSSRSGPR